MIIKTVSNRTQTALATTTLLLAMACFGTNLAYAATAAKTTNKAASSSSASSSTIQTTTSSAASLQGYSSTSSLQYGLIVQLTGKDVVGPATEAKAANMYGVTVNPNQLSYTVSSSNLQNETYVATSGTYDLLVSTQNGPIAVGDYVTISSIDGVGMEAGTSNTTVFGRAAEAFTAKSANAGSETLKNSAGVTQTVAIGEIPVAVQIEHNPSKISTTENLPKTLQRIGQAIADKPISPIKIYLSIAITIASISTAVSVLYSGVRGSQIAIGRNPMSKRSIFRSLFSIILAGFIILMIGFFAVYLLLKL
jgi:hypothetical protein